MSLTQTHTLTVTLTLQATNGKEKVVRVLASESDDGGEMILTDKQQSDIRRRIASIINEYFQ
jgi:hypothetical protein